jgi:CRISPR system Cascade subunit CasE
LGRAGGRREVAERNFGACPITWLTQVDLPFDAAARLQLRDSYDWHQAVWKAFPGRDGQRRDFLTRLDARREGFRLLLASQTEPTRPAWCPPECWKTKRIPESYFSNRLYRFQLCANPTRKIDSKPDGTVTKNGRRVPLHTREELLAWIGRKGEQGGFTVDKGVLRTYCRGRESFQKRDKERDGKTITGLHSAVEFEGVLTVTNPSRFYETFTRGIGSAKAFGFGLLVIAPID